MNERSFVADRLLRAIRIKELHAELSAAREEIERLRERCCDLIDSCRVPKKLRKGAGHDRFQPCDQHVEQPQRHR
jgi:hypothetical protein